VARSTWAFAVAELVRVDGGRRLHGQQREHLQEVALHHVDQSARRVVVTGSALEREVLIKHDVNGRNVLGI
jgi:hypothetical protein